MRTRIMLAMLLAMLLPGGGELRAQPAQQQRSFFSLFWQVPQQPVVQPRPRRVAPSVRRRAPAPAIPASVAIVPKVEIAHRVLVIGDSLASLLADGLEDALEDRPDVAVLDRARSDSGLVRSDYHDWRKVAEELLAAEPAISVGIMLIGLNDRQAIREGDVVHEPLSPRWQELYRSRIAAIAAAFAQRRVPLVWVGAPPVQNTRLSADFTGFNELYRDQAEKAGGAYVDLWGGFVDAENRYTAMGPDVSGQTMRLRAGDGIHFTAAGARKAAHFVDVVIRRLIEGRQQQPALALPVSPETGAPINPELQPGGIERLIDAMVGNQFSNIGLPAALRVKPLAGPVLPLAAQSVVTDQGLLSSPREARGRDEAGAQLDRVFVEGMLPEPKPGRLDDHRWPR